MMSRLLLLLCLGLRCLARAALVFLTEDNPPFNYVENGQVDGLATAMITEMAKRAVVARDLRTGAVGKRLPARAARS